MNNNRFYINLAFRIFPKARPRMGKWNKFYTPTSAEEEELSQEIDYQMREKGLKAFGKVKLFLYYRFYFIKKANGDIDNFEKSLMDSLQGIAYTNDRQIKKIDGEIIEDYGEDRIVFRLEEIK